ncbi:MAG: hypothetical protein DHS20C11_12370 [Lysobacteraceae bacterium]|nr:MAG: hypothetical protein DHS20C11_12370 [Xanthomonadaceae bacterium]
MQVADAMMSRKHALVFVRQGRLYLCDAGSANGTRVNGIRVFERRRLMCGDVFELGTHRFSVIYVASTGGHCCAYRSVASSEVDLSQSLVA